MVSITRCPVQSDPVKKWSERRAAAPKGRCLVGHRGEFPYVHPERSDFRLERANLRPHRAYFRPERAEYKPGRVDLWPKLADFWPNRTDFGPKC